MGLRVKGLGAQGVDSSKISATHGGAAHIVAQTAYQHPEKGEPRMAKRVSEASLVYTVSGTPARQLDSLLQIWARAEHQIIIAIDDIHLAAQGWMPGLNTFTRSPGSSAKGYLETTPLISKAIWPKHRLVPQKKIAGSILLQTSICPSPPPPGPLNPRP